MELYRRADSPFWWFSATVNGRRVRGSTGASTKAGAGIIARQKIAEAEARIPQQGRWRVHVLTGTYLSSHGAHLANVATVTYQLGNLTRLLGKDRFIADLTGADIIAYRAKRRGEGVGPGSVNRELTLLRAALGYAKAHFGQAIPDIQWRGLFLKEPPGRTRFLSREEYEALIAACDDELRAIVLVAVNTGLRRANIESLTWEQIDLAHGVARFVMKGNRARVIKLNAPVVAALGRTAPEKRRGAVFTQPNRRKRWEAALKNAGLADFRFHDLRHTFASWARINGADIADICEALNHSDIKMTMRYAHITPETHRTAFDAVGEVFAEMSRPRSQDTPEAKKA